jgi:16S rRNA G1207 methylase RsmC
VYYNFTLTSVELNEDNCKVLESKGYKPINTDFMTMPVKDRFDLIIANPPFTKNQDIDHIRKMYEHLDNGGIIVTLASRHWIHSTKRKETEFRNWLEGKECYREDIEEGTFKESGTNISTVMLVIGK